MPVAVWVVRSLWLGQRCHFFATVLNIAGLSHSDIVSRERVRKRPLPWDFS